MVVADSVNKLVHNGPVVKTSIGNLKMLFFLENLGEPFRLTNLYPEALGASLSADGRTAADSSARSANYYFRSIGRSGGSEESDKITHQTQTFHIRPLLPQKLNWPWGLATYRKPFNIDR